MDVPSQREREALLELLLAMGGPLLWTGPIPYDALAARHAADHPDAADPHADPDAPPAQAAVAAEPGGPTPPPTSRHAA